MFYKAVVVMVVGPLLLGNTVPPEDPIMNSFYTECMKRGGLPDHASTTKREVYSGPKYMFHIWSPLVANTSGNIELKVYHFVNRTPTQSVEVIKTIMPGESLILQTDKFSVQNGFPRGSTTGVQFCIRQMPIIDLSELGSLGTKTAALAVERTQEQPNKLTDAD